MSSLIRTHRRQAARDRGEQGPSPGPHKTRDAVYFRKARARRRVASKIAGASREVNR